MSRPHIVVVGSINLDLVARVRSLPRPGETVLAAGLQTFPGGKGANQAVAAARLGARVSFIGRVGSDAAGGELRRALAQDGVDDRAVFTSNGSSGTAIIATDQAGENEIIVVGGANQELTPADLDGCSALIASASLVLTQLEVPLATVERTAEICTREHIPLMLDPAPATALPERLLRQVTWLTPNETEAATLLGNPPPGLTPEQVVTELQALGSRNVVLKCGSRGVTLAGTGTGSASIRSFAVSAIDTTAAGDAFNGAFAFALGSGQPPQEAARFANAAAALSVTRAGAQPSMPTLAEVEALMRSDLP